MRVRNVRYLLEAKLDSKINARFLLIEHGDPNFLMREYKLHNISQFEEKFKILLNYFDFNALKSTFLGTDRYMLRICREFFFLILVERELPLYYKLNSL